MRGGALAEDRLDVVHERGLLRAETVEYRGDDVLPEGDDDWREKAAGCPGQLGSVGLALSEFQRPRGSSAALPGRAPPGVDVTTEAYPYTAGSTSLHRWIFDGGWQGRLGIDYGDLQRKATGEPLTRGI